MVSARHLSCRMDFQNRDSCFGREDRVRDGPAFHSL